MAKVNADQSAQAAQASLQAAQAAQAGLQAGRAEIAARAAQLASSGGEVSAGLAGALSRLGSVGQGALDSLKNEAGFLREQVAACIAGLEATAPGPKGEAAAAALAGALEDGASLGKAAELVSEGAAQAREDMRTVVDPLADDLSYANALEKREGGAESSLWYERADQACRAARALHEASGSLERSAEALEGGGSLGEARACVEKEGDALRSRSAQLAFQGDFSSTPALEKTWNRALESARESGRGSPSWRKVQREFWTRVNAGVDEDARRVASIVELAGYRLEGESRAPRLDLEWELGEEELEKGEEEIRHFESINRSQRVLSIDHANPQSLSAEERFDPQNLRFMSGWDNSVRGNRYTRTDIPREDADRRGG